MGTEVSVTEAPATAPEAGAGSSAEALAVEATQAAADASAVAQIATHEASVAQTEAETAREEIDEVEAQIAQVQEWQNNLTAKTESTAQQVAVLVENQAAMAEVLRSLAERLTPPAESPQSEGAAAPENPTAEIPPAQEREMPEERQERENAYAAGRRRWM